MFDDQYRFRGIHATYTKMLTNVFDSASKTKLFERNIDVYINAPIIGFIYNRKANLDNTKDLTTGQIFNQNIMGETVIHSKDDLVFNYQLIMLLDKQYEPDLNKRIDKAFRTSNVSAEDEALFESYVRGGIEVLYEKLIKEAKEPKDFIANLYDFIEDFYGQFNSELSNDDMLKLSEKNNDR